MPKWAKQENYHFRAILIGVVRHEVNRSAGSSEFMGKSSLGPHAASCIQCFPDRQDPELCDLPFTAYKKLNEKHHKWLSKNNNENIGTK